MNRSLLSLLGSMLVVSLFVVDGFGQDPGPAESILLSDLSARARAAIEKGQTDIAIQSADAMLRHHPDDPRAMRLSADIFLRTGKVDSAARLFDRYLEAQPGEMRGLWQRGIALYFVGDYKRAAKQFEEHRKVNPNDVENAAWHFLCVSKADSLDQARRLVLPAPNDPRIPMEEVRQMLTSGDSGAVTRRVNSLPIDSGARARAAFYGDFYLGLYADANGDRDQANQLLVRAAKDAPHHYMGDIARVYAKHLAK